MLEAVHSGRAGERKIGRSFFQIPRTEETERGRRSDNSEATNEGFRFDTLCVLAFHLLNHKDDYIPLYLFIGVLECQEIIVTFGEIL